MLKLCSFFGGNMKILTFVEFFLKAESFLFVSAVRILSSFKVCFSISIVLIFLITDKAKAAELYKPKITNSSLENYFFKGNDGRQHKMAVRNVDGALIYQGDIVVKRKNSPQMAAGVTPFLRWTDGVIPFYLLPGHPDTALILSAIDNLNRNTVLWFKPTTNFSENYISIQNEDTGCHAEVGTPVFGDGTIVNIGPKCKSFGVITHELLHAAGLWHEQSRSDRDLYVKINFNNIIPDERYNFEKEDGLFSKDIGEYNFSSLMHYGCKDYASDKSKFSIESITGTHPMGQRVGLSQGDIDAIRAMYYDISASRGKPLMQPTSVPALTLQSYPAGCFAPANDSSPLDWKNASKIAKQQSKATPALATFGGKLHMVHLGNSSNDIWHSSFDGSNWTTNVKIPNQQSKASPALAMFGGKLHMVHLGNSSNDIWHSSFNGNSWTTNVKIPNQQSKSSPTLAAYKNRLHMLHQGDSSNDLWASNFDGTTWTANTRAPHLQSKFTPAIADFSNHISIIFVDKVSNDLWFSSSDD